MTSHRAPPLSLFVRMAATVVTVVAVAWWLFADTYHRHVSTQGDGNSIRFAHFGTYEDYELWRDVIARFEAAHPQAHVRQEYVVGFSGRYHTKLGQQILSHTLPDVALVQLGPFPRLARHFAPLGPLAQSLTKNAITLSDSLYPSGVEAFRWGGRLHGLPVSGGNLLIYGNMDCFERAGAFRGEAITPPGKDWTMEEFRKLAQRLTCDFDGDGEVDQFGFWLPRWVYYLPFLWSFGAEPTNSDMTRWTLIGREAESAIRFYRDLAVESRVCPREAEVPQLFQDTGFLTGRVALCVNGPWFQPFLARTRLAHRYFVAPIPRGPAGRVTRITWDAVVMAPNLSDRRRRTAGDFISFLLSAQVQDRIAGLGRALPARMMSAKNFVKPSGDAPRSAFVKALAYSRLQPRWPHFAEVDRAINRCLNRVRDPDEPMTVHDLLDLLAHDPAIQAAFPSALSSLPAEKRR